MLCTIYNLLLARNFQITHTFLPVCCCISKKTCWKGQRHFKVKVNITWYKSYIYFKVMVNITWYKGHILWMVSVRGKDIFLGRFSEERLTVLPSVRPFLFLDRYKFLQPRTNYRYTDQKMFLRYNISDCKQFMWSQFQWKTFSVILFTSVWEWIVDWVHKFWLDISFDP